MSNHEIIRVKKTAGTFAVMHKGFLVDDRLSFKAKGQQCITYPNLQKYAIISHMANHTGGIYAKSITVRL